MTVLRGAASEPKRSSLQKRKHRKASKCTVAQLPLLPDLKMVDRMEVAQTVASPDEVEQEVRELLTFVQD